MPDSFIQVAPDSSGRKLRSRQRVVGADTVEEQLIALSSEPTWWLWTGAQTPAQNRQLLSGFNVTGSGQVIKLKKLFLFNVGITSITAAALTCDFKKATAVSAGTAVTPQIMDSVDTALANFTCVQGGTVTEGAALWTAALNTAQMSTTSAAVMGWQQQQTNLMLESIETKEMTLNPGEGFTLKQITAVTTGSLAVLAAITRAV